MVDTELASGSVSSGPGLAFRSLFRNRTDSLRKVGTPVRKGDPQHGMPLLFESDRPWVPYLSARRRRELALKRGLDVLLAGFALFALAVPLLGIIALIRLESPGPAVFRQTRLGYGAKPFGMFKFRTMRSEDCDHTGVAQTLPDDPRVTSLGRWLRKTSIDELPQLLNVLRGEMSLVGPRPYVPGMQAAGRPYERLVPYYDLRYLMMPGVTGWAQAHGLRGSTDSADLSKARIDHDVAYIQHFSIALDFRILARTVVKESIGGSGF